jgi:predicted chitinase
MYIVHCPDRATSCLISLITLHISSQKLGEGRKWGNRGKRGEKAGKYQGKDKRRKSILYMHKICRKEGGWDQRGRSKETGRDNYVSCLQQYFRAYIFSLLL